MEKDVPSKELYPIHHLDDHEFFPGDFVTEAKDGFHPHSYGVVQEVKSTEFNFLMEISRYQNCNFTWQIQVFLC